MVEGPTVMKHGTSHYPFYSANAFNTANYSTGQRVMLRKAFWGGRDDGIRDVLAGALR